MKLPEVLSYYSRKEVQEALLQASKSREVVGVFRNKNFGKRPNVLQYPSDILHMVREGVVSFHGSVELWSNPMALSTSMGRGELDRLRIGWDVLLDIDVKDFEIAKLATKQIIEALKDHGVTNYSCKYTGGASFHIGIPFDALPEKVNLQPTALQYPELFEKIVSYLKWYVHEQLREEILSLDNPLNLAKRVGKTIGEVTSEHGLEPFHMISMDVFGSRHLFRLPYSLNENSFLVSLPIDPKRIHTFKKEEATPTHVKVKEKFLIQKVKLHDAEALTVEALDWASRHRVEKLIPKKPLKPLKVRFITEKYFPPCIHHILGGLPDGRKRSVFILINFLRNMGWNWEKVEEKLVEWNGKNYAPLRNAYLRGQLRWHTQQERNLLPPNCDNPNFYRDFGVCKPDELCQGLKNPVNYPFKKLRRV